MMLLGVYQLAGWWGLLTALGATLLLFGRTELRAHSAADVVAKAQAILSEPALLRAMSDVGYFPPNTSPGD